MLQRKASRWMSVGGASLILTTALFFFIQPIFQWIARLGGASFLAAALALGLAMAAGPIATVACGLMALFLRVEVCFAPQTATWRMSDRLSVGAGLLVSFAPALAALYPPIRAILSGYIGFRGPGQQYYRLTDPYGFWQATAFWMMGAVSLAIVASIYWRAKWRDRKTSA